MNRLSQELQRLCFAPATDGAAAVADAGQLLAADGQVRAMVLELARPADWDALSRLWRAVQAELGLPAPAIAVNGRDGYQLWFSLAQPLPAALALAWLQALQQRHLGEIQPQRVRCQPGPASPPLAQVPALQGTDDSGERWSAFVSADLAPMFADTPWLDMPPNPEGQAGLLATLRCIGADVLQASLLQLGLVEAAVLAAPATADGGGGGATATAHSDPRRFLLAVMQDSSAPLALRIEAAKALLPYGAPAAGPLAGGG